MGARIFKRVKSGHRVRLAARESGVRGEAVLANIGPHGLCLTDIRWAGAGNRSDTRGVIDVHLPIPDWVGCDIRVKPVRIRFGEDSIEIGAEIVETTDRFGAVLESLGLETAGAP